MKRRLIAPSLTRSFAWRLVGAGALLACSVYDEALLHEASSAGGNAGGNAGGSASGSAGRGPGVSAGSGGGDSAGRSAVGGSPATGTGGQAGMESDGSAGAGGSEELHPCQDRSLNGNETDVDCGGDVCSACSFGSACDVDTDCSTEHCIGKQCTTVDCSNRVRDGSETDVDCGGDDCGRCDTDELCLEHDGCFSGVCAMGRCSPQRTCAEIKLLVDASVSRIYDVDPDGPVGSEPDFRVFCDMTSDGGGFSRVGFERAGAGGNGVLGALALLGLNVGTSDAVANASAPSLVGSRFNGLYTELRLTWGNDYAQMTVPENIFVDGVKPNIMVTAFSSSNSVLSGWVTSAGGAVFCRASSSTVRPGDTSWAIKPRTSADNACGCNGNVWAGQGIFYGGLIPASVCTDWGGAWAGVRANGERKGGLVSATDLGLWIR